MSNIGRRRELQVRDYYRGDGWVAFNAPASLGVADVIALKAGHNPQLVECKASATAPYKHFPPADRARLSAAAKQAGADAVLAWWPSRKPLQLIPESEWPAS